MLILDLKMSHIPHFGHIKFPNNPTYSLEITTGTISENSKT